MTRQVLSEFEAAGIGLASTTFEVVGLPKLHVAAETEADRPQLAS